ncbi:transposase [Filibacter tadaridae]|uniref:Transposase IS200 like protein n=1 Tax=Filibacter tadaridae TaxID=2483811 RepID=A0A3P5X1F6_9BACL|nr:transposase [Filibacter tadaridae]VDC25140.1 Transposase IS200 like protein [Filibacter tadaridae]
MTRRKREWHPNAYFHVVMRGNNRQSIYQTQEDQQELMRAIEYTYDKYHFTLLAYCFMTNHFHLLIRSEYVDLSKVMARINRRYTDYYAKRYGHVGRIYQKRYFSKEVDGPQAILAVSSYIHRNPIETFVPMVANLEAYPYSSFPYYANEAKVPPRFLKTDLVATFLPNPFEKTNQAYCLYCLTYKQQDIEEDQEDE